MTTTEQSAVFDLKKMAARPFDEAVAMPPSVYTSEEFLARERSNVFRKDWICVGRASALAKTGDYLTRDIAGQPVLVLRDTTERPEAVDIGTVKLVGTQSNTIIREANQLLDDVRSYKKMSKAHNPYGDGKAVERIIKGLLNA